MADFTVVEDTFSRTITDDWGRSDNGTDWEIISGPAADFDVDGDEGIITYSDLTDHVIGIPGNFTRLNGYWEVIPSAVATGGNFVQNFRIRDTSNGTDNYLAVQVEFLAAGTVSIALYEINNSVVTPLGAASKGAYSAGQRWHVRFQMGSGSTLTAKLWSTTEPSTWDVTATETATPGPGGIRVRAAKDAGNTNGASLNVKLDNILVTTFVPTLQIVPQFLEDYEFKFGHDGLLLNAGQSNATPGNPVWDIRKVTGLDLPDVKVSDKEFDGIDGGVIDAVNISMRTVRLDGTLYAHQDDSLEGYLDQLKANFAPVPRESSGEFFDPNQKPFFIKTPGQDERFLFAKPVALSYDWDPDRRFNTTPFQIILQCQVPTLLSPELHMVSADLSGLIGTEHILKVYNAGNYYSYAIVRFFQIGNFPDVHVKHVEQDKELSMFMGQTESVANRPVEINMRQRTIFVIDEPPVNFRQDVVAEGWWRLAPGMNTIAVRTDVSNDGSVQILWRDEWF